MQLSNLPPLTVEPREGDGQLVFELMDLGFLSDGKRCLRALGSIDGREVGFDLVYRWFTLNGWVELRSIGGRSDQLVRGLDAMYQTNVKPKRMARRVKCEGLLMAGNLKHPEQRGAWVKVLLFDDVKEIFAQLSLTIDWKKSRLGVSEKWTGDRENLVRLLESGTKLVKKKAEAPVEEEGAQIF